MLFVPEEGAITLCDNENLIVFPLLKDEIALLKNDKEYFENYLNVKYNADFEFDEDGWMQNQFKLFKKSRSKLPWCSIWVITSAKDKSIIGTINFKNSPYKTKIVEVGYFVNPNYRNNGYATTALKLLSDWAFTNKVKSITAKTAKENLASQKVLEKNGFVVDKKTKNEVFYIKNKQKSSK